MSTFISNKMAYLWGKLMFPLAQKEHKNFKQIKQEVEPKTKRVKAKAGGVVAPNNRSIHSGPLQNSSI